MTTRGGMNMLPHCVQTSVVDLGPRGSGLSFRKKPTCMCRSVAVNALQKSHSDNLEVWRQDAAEVVERA